MIDAVEFGKQMGGIVRDAVAPILKRIAALEARQLERGPQGEKGLDGPQGERGEAGQVGEPGKDADPIDLADIARELATLPEINTVLDLLATEAVIKHFEENPVVHGKDGRDGLDVKDMFRNHEGHLIAVMSDGTTRDLGEFIGKDGRDGIDGKDGADGLGFDDMTPSYDPAKGLTLTYSHGDAKKEITIPLVAMEHIGFWRDGMPAKTLNTTTHNGNLWIARRETTATPCHENPDDWSLAARKGTDGKPGPAGKDYTPPNPIKLSGE